METALFLRDLVVLFGIAVLVSYVFRVLKLSSIAGFLVAGALGGPFGLRLISNLEDVQRMSEVGVMLLLFSIGVEFSAEKLLRMKWVALVGGGFQLALTTTLTALIVYAFVDSARMAVLAGMLAALSSTVIGLRLLHDRGQTHSPQGSVALAILIFQDIAVVPAMLFLPLLTGSRSFDLRSLITTTVVSLIAVVGILAAAWFVAPRIIAATIRARSRDVFILSVITVVLGTAYLTSRAGLSTALGAFVAGIVISESEYSHQVLADVLPFRETFNSLFFVSIGMLLDPAFLLAHLGIVSAAALAVVAGKTAITAAAVALLGMPWRIALAVGLFLGQVGEFSLVLLNVGRSSTEVLETFSQMALSVILMTMVLAPFLAMIADRVASRAGAAPARATAAEPLKLSDHTIVIGFGLNGRNVAASLRSHGMPYAIVEMNPRLVRAGKMAGEPILYGDALSETVLKSAGVAQAQIVVFAISDPAATRVAVAAARALNAGAYIIARTRYLDEINRLYSAGADTVIAEEFETSLEIIRRILGRLGYRPATIDREVLMIRQRRYEIFRGGPIEKAPIPTSAVFEPFEIEVRPQSSGKSVAQLGVRENTGATIIAIRRNSDVITNPAAGEIIHEGDHVYLIGSEEQIRRAMRLL